MMVLNDIIDQAARRPSARSSGRRSTFAESEEGFRLKDRISAMCARWIDLLCIWDCCYVYIKFAELLSIIVFDPFTDLFITLCIVVNTAFMALDSHNIDPTMNQTLVNGNYVSVLTNN